MYGNALTGILASAVSMCQAVQAAVSRLPATASLSQVEGDVIEGVQKAARWFNNRKPEVIAVAWEHDPRAAILPDLAAQAPHRPGQPSGVRQSAAAGSSGSSTDGSSRGSQAGSSSSPPRRAPPRLRRAAGGAKQLPPLQVLPKDVELPVTHQNPRQNPAAAGPDADLAYD